jgi:hypothetical protein
MRRDLCLLAFLAALGGCTPVSEPIPVPRFAGRSDAEDRAAARAFFSPGSFYLVRITGWDPARMDPGDLAAETAVPGARLAVYRSSPAAGVRDGRATDDFCGDREVGEADLLHATEEFELRTSGNLTRGTPKSSYKIEFTRRAERMFDMTALNLKSMWNDVSQMREVGFAWPLLRAAGLAASRAVYAKLCINDRYYGLYALIEQVDGAFLDEHFAANDEGNLYKAYYCVRGAAGACQDPAGPADLAYRSSRERFPEAPPDDSGRQYFFCDRALGSNACVGNDLYACHDDGRIGALSQRCSLGCAAGRCLEDWRAALGRDVDRCEVERLRPERVPDIEDRTYRLKTNDECDDPAEYQTYDDLARFIRTIHGIGIPGGEARFASEAYRRSVEQIFDVYAALRKMSVIMLAGAWDNYYKTPANYYLYNSGVRGAERDFMSQPYFHWIPWDYDHSFGARWDDVAWEDRDVVAWDVGHELPLVHHLLRNDHFLAYYLDHMEYLLDTVFQPAEVDRVIGRTGSGGLWDQVRFAAFLESASVGAAMDDLDVQRRPAHTGRRFTFEQIYWNGYKHHELHHWGEYLLGIREHVRRRHDSARAQIARHRERRLAGARSGAVFPAAPVIPARE